MRTLTKTIAALAVLTLLAAACSGDDDEAAVDEAAVDEAPVDETTSDMADDDIADDDTADDDIADDDTAAAMPDVECAVDEIDGDLNMYNWSEYIDEELLEQFG